MSIKKYGKTKEQQDILDSAKCREIVNEILNFGVNQNQLLTIMKLLALELEDRSTMVEITKIIDSDLTEDNGDDLTPTIEV